MEKLAIIGTGIAGMGAAHLLQKKYNLQLFEQNNYIGGHTNTISVDEGNLKVHMDTGFMVFNKVTYPNLCRLFDEIKAPVKKTDMSFSVQHVPTGLEYCGSGLNGLFAQRKNLFNLSFIKMLAEISRFNKTSQALLTNHRYDEYSLERYMKEFGFSSEMLWKYLVPMSSAVWSTPMDKMLDFPATTLIRFFKNHGFLGLNTQHQWYTLENGSQSYRELLIKPFRDKIHINKKVLAVATNNNSVTLTFNDNSQQSFDKVILACHADQALALLQNASNQQQKLLSPFKYQKNLATVHSDTSVMPKNKRTWSSWNYRIELENGKPMPSTIYWMNNLQGVSPRKNYFVSINAVPGSIDKNKVITEIDYEHPLFDLAAIQAQKDLNLLNREGALYFCGSYFNYGFHEDAYTSAVNLSKML